MKARASMTFFVVFSLVAGLLPGSSSSARQIADPDLVEPSPPQRPLTDAPPATHVGVNDALGTAAQRNPSVAVDSSGNAYAVWEDTRNGDADIYFSYRPVGESWDTNVRVNDDLGTALQMGPSIAADSNGNAYAAWEDRRHGGWAIYFSYRPAGGSWGTNERVDAGSWVCTVPSIAVDPGGNAYVVWEDLRGDKWDIYFSYRPAGGPWSTNVRVSDDLGPGEPQQNPSIAVDPSGNAYALWRDSRDGDDDIYFSYRPAQGSWGANVRVNDDPGTARQQWTTDSSIAVDPSGNAYAVWCDERDGGWAIYFSHRPAGASWGTNERVNDDPGTAWSYYPSIGVDSSGNTYAACHDVRNGNGDIYFSYRPSGGSWSTNVRVNDDLGTAWQENPSVSVDPSGNAYAVWGDSRSGNGDIYFSYRPVGGDWGANVKVNDDAGPPTCDRIPVILVHGWHSSKQDDLAQDYQMNLFADMLRGDGYADDQTLFYATGISEKNKLDNNALALQQTVRRAAEQSGCSAVDIIGHSMGGINTRAYVESRLHQDDVDSGIRVRNVFMLGTPNGGVEGNLIQIAFGLWGAAQDGNILNDIQSIKELTVAYMQAFNLSHTQPSSVRYHLIGGDVRSQLPILCLLGACYPNDGLAARDSVHWLAYIPGHNVTTYSTSDGHGCDDFFTSRGVPTYNCPDTTYRAHIAPHLSSVGEHAAGAVQFAAANDAHGSALHYEPQEPMSHTPLFTGVITTGESVSETVSIDSGGTTAFYAAWTRGDLSFSLTDPIGTNIISSTAELDPNLGFFRLETDALFNYQSYVISDTVTGDWVVSVEAIDTYSEDVPFAAFAIPDSELSLSVFTDQDWYPKNLATAVTATLSLATTPVTDAMVEATIYRPDTISDTITLHDDGAHNDGLADDGIYGNSYPSTDVGGYYAVLATASGNLSGTDYERGAETGFSVSPETAALADSYSDYPEDADGNGKHEHLVVNVGVSVVQAGSFELSAKLLDGNGDLAVGASDYISLTVGVQDVPLRFDGEAIRTHGVDGPYTVTDVYLFDASGVAVKLDEAFDVWTTAAYDHNIFGDDWLIHMPLVTKNY